MTNSLKSDQSLVKYGVLVLCFIDEDFHTKRGQGTFLLLGSRRREVGVKHCT